MHIGHQCTWDIAQKAALKKLNRCVSFHTDGSPVIVASHHGHLRIELLGIRTQVAEPRGYPYVVRRGRLKPRLPKRPRLFLPLAPIAGKHYESGADMLVRPCRVRIQSRIRLSRSPPPKAPSTGMIKGSSATLPCR